MLDEVGSECDRGTTAGSLFTRPVFEIKLSLLSPLIGRVLSNPDLFVDRAVQYVHLAPVAARFSAALQRCPTRTSPWRTWRGGCIFRWA